MVASCCVPGCTNRKTKDATVKMNRFPSQDYHPDRYNMWVIKINRLPPPGQTSYRADGLWEPKDHDRVCSAHFISGKPSKDPNHPDYVPSVFSFNRKQSLGKEKKSLSTYNSGVKRKISLFQFLTEEAAGTSDSTVTSSSTIATRKRKSDNPNCGDGKIFKTEEGGMVEVRQISNTSVTANKDIIVENIADENTSNSIRTDNSTNDRTEHRTEDSTGKENGEVRTESSKTEIKTFTSQSASVDDQLDIKPDKALLDKKMKEKDVPATNRGSQTVPVVMKLASLEETELLKLSAVEKNAMLLSKTRELEQAKGNLEETKRNLTNLQGNIFRLLKIIDPNCDYGEPENVEKFILQFIKFNEEKSQEASGS